MALASGPAMTRRNGYAPVCYLCKTRITGRDKYRVWAEDDDTGEPLVGYLAAHVCGPDCPDLGGRKVFVRDSQHHREYWA